MASTPKKTNRKIRTGSVSAQAGADSRSRANEEKTASAEMNSTPNTATRNAVIPSEISTGTKLRRLRTLRTGPARNHGTGNTASPTDSSPLATPAQPRPPDSASEARTNAASRLSPTSQSASPEQRDEHQPVGGEGVGDAPRGDAVPDGREHREREGDRGQHDAETGRGVGGSRPPRPAPCRSRPGGASEGCREGRGEGRAGAGCTRRTCRSAARSPLTRPPREAPTAMPTQTNSRNAPAACTSVLGPIPKNAAAIAPATNPATAPTTAPRIAPPTER